MKSKTIARIIVLSLFILLFIFIGLYIYELKKEPRIVEYHTEFPATCLGDFKVTFYCPCEKCTGSKKPSKTSVGVYPQPERTVAVDPEVIPYGSIIYVEDLGYYIAEDCGGAIKSNKIDIFVNSHEQAVNSGVQKKRVWLMNNV